MVLILDLTKEIVEPIGVQKMTLFPTTSAFSYTQMTLRDWNGMWKTR